MSEMDFPNFIIIGAARSGTSSLYEYMKQHPDIYFPELKEPMFFAFAGRPVKFSGPGDDKEINRKAITDLAQYQKLFKNRHGEKAVGEASANYLYSENAAQNIKKYVPHAKLIVVLRNPVERAYSSYLYTLRDGRERLRSFEEALQQEGVRIKNNWEHIWHYANMGFYFRQLQKYLSLFPRSNIKIILQEDLKSNPQLVLADVFEFLEVDHTFIPDFSIEFNQGGKPKSDLLNKILTRPSRVKQWLRPLLPGFLMKIYINLKHNNLEKPQLSSQTRANLVELYKDDIEGLQQLIQKDLSSWTRGGQKNA